VTKQKKWLSDRRINRSRPRSRVTKDDPEDELKLYSELSSPYSKGFLPVSKDPAHAIYYAEYGNPEGKPLLYVHGGPGGDIAPQHLQLIDPKKYRIIVFNQRGCGQSTFGKAPYKANDISEAMLADAKDTPDQVSETTEQMISDMLADNTIGHSVDDMHALLGHLGLKDKKVALFAGSYGTTLSLAYAITYPQTVERMILRGLFLDRESDRDNVLERKAEDLANDVKQGNVARFEKAWENYAGFIDGRANDEGQSYDLSTRSVKHEEKPYDAAHIVKSYLNMLYDPSANKRIEAAMRYQHYTAVATGFADKNAEPAINKDSKNIPPSYIELTYLAHGCFLKEWAEKNSSNGVRSKNIENNDYLLGNLDRIKDIPITVISGKNDCITPPKVAQDFVRAFRKVQPKPRARPILIQTEAAHPAMDDANARALIRATNDPDFIARTPPSRG